MSLGSRIIKRGKAATVANLASTPREPLLFLYPQWIWNTSTASELAFIRNGRPRLSPARHYIIQSMARCNATTRIRVINHHKTDPVKNDPEVPSEESVDMQSGIENSVTEERLPMVMQNTQTYGETISKSNIQNRNPNPDVKMKNSSVHKFGSGNQARISKAIKNQEQARTDTLRNRAFRKVYQANRREQTQSWIPDWRVILEQLRKHTPQHDEWLEKAVKISVPETAFELLYDGVDDNMWDIADQYDCSVELANRKFDTGQYNEFLISGPAASISKTAAEVLRIAPESKLKAGPQALSSLGFNTTTLLAPIDSEDERNSVVEIRLVSSQKPRMLLGTKPEDILRPSKWTTRTFADYVTDLTSINMPNHLHKLNYKGKENHIESVVAVLRELFMNPDCRTSMSRTAFNQAIAFYVKTARIPDARAFFVLMEIMEIKMNPETFNILLRGAAKQQDLHVFQFILHLMQRRGVIPNGQTWITFLMANYEFGIKTHIVAAMKDKGLLSHMSTLKGVCDQLVTQEVNASLDLGQSQDDFLDHMDSRYGNKWLSVDSGNRVLHALGSRCLISRCWDFLRVMDARRIKPDQVSINTILNNCKVATNVTGAIEIVGSLPSLFQFVPDEHTYHILFELAWRSRSYNLARIVWKYACLNAATTRKMRKLVRESLLNASKTSSTQTSDLESSSSETSILSAEISRQNLTQYQIWKQQAGLFITSNVFDLPTADFPDLPINAPFGGLEHQVSEASSHKAELQRAVNALLERDYEFCRRLVTTRPFGEMLREAWERDCIWQNSRMETRGIDQDLMRHRAIVVPI